MADYKSMYYHLAGRMATTVEVMETTSDILGATTNALVEIKDSIAELTATLKLAQQATEEMFVNCEASDVE